MADVIPSPEPVGRRRPWCRVSAGGAHDRRHGVQQIAPAADPNLAQARHLIGALRDHLREMAPRLARAEREAIGGHTRVARARRLEAEELRRDVSQAQLLIERLHRRFPGIDGTQADQRGNVDHIRQLNRRPHRWPVNAPGSPPEGSSNKLSSK